MGRTQAVDATATGEAGRRRAPGGRRLALLAALIGLVACGGAVPPGPQGGSGTPVAVSPSPPVASPSAPVASPPAPVASPPTPVAQAPQSPARTEFTAAVAAGPGTLVRVGPGMDMPAVDVEPVGRLDTFDGWVRRADDPPQADATTERIEWWSRDWFHLADGRGWVASAAVRGLQPEGMAPSPWTRPASLPAPTAALLDIPLDLQDQPVTCELAALKMALRYRGIPADEQSLLALTGVDARPPELGPRGTIVRWGDPSVTFVGNPAGHISDRTGYGVYAAPVARAAVEAGATVLASGAGIPPSDVYAAVIAGHPVVAWVTADYQPASLGTWLAWDGTTVRYALTEHAVLVIGVSPTTVYLDDPWSGQTWLTRAGFAAVYATFGDMAVVVG